MDQNPAKVTQSRAEGWASGAILHFNHWVTIWWAEFQLSDSTTGSSANQIGLFPTSAPVAEMPIWLHLHINDDMQWLTHRTPQKDRPGRVSVSSVSAVLAAWFSLTSHCALLCSHIVYSCPDHFDLTSNPAEQIAGTDLPKHVRERTFSSAACVWERLAMFRAGARPSHDIVISQWFHTFDDMTSHIVRDTCHIWWSTRWN